MKKMFNNILIVIKVNWLNDINDIEKHLLNYIFQILILIKLYNN